MSKTGNSNTVVAEPNARIVRDPILLLGAERSGTTLLLLLLGHHPDICFPGEFDYAIRCIPDTHPLRLEDYYQALENDRVFIDRQLKIDDKLNLEELLNSFLIQLRDRSEKSRIGASIHFNYEKNLAVWPDAKVIHIVRDPRDVATSCIQMGWAGNVWSAIDKWVESERNWDNVSASIPENNKIEIHFEDMIGNIKGVLSDICHFVGLEYSEDMLRFHEDTTYAPIDSSIAQKWPKKLSDKEIRLIESKVGSLLEKKGYQPSGLPVLTLSPLQQWKLKIQNAYWVRMFSIKRYGLRLSILRPLARHLGLAAWTRKINLEFYKIQKQYIK